MTVSSQTKFDINAVKLTQYSHGAGCGCKISPAVLDKILQSNLAFPDNKNLLVGNHSKDDAAVYNLSNGAALIATTDFFMPVVDDPFEFGRIAAANALSDVYAMGGKPLLAIAILGWPINKLPAEVAQQVVEGGRSICAEAGIVLAGGHSIDNAEPLFGLAVNGLVNTENIKQNNTAKENDILFITKPLGIGILTTAVKKNILLKEHEGIASKQMMQLNNIGEALGTIKEVHAMTDVTGFGLLGHLAEMAEGSGLSARIDFEKIPFISDLKYYLDQNCIPGGTHRNWESYGGKIDTITEFQKNILADPQTSGGLLIAVDPEAKHKIEELFTEYNLEKFLQPIGKFIAKNEKVIYIKSNTIL